MLYNAYEMTQAAFSPMHATARFVQAGMQNPINPVAAFCRPSHASAALEIFLDVTRRYAKPEFGLSSTLVDGVDTPVREQVVWAKPFCRLLHFRRILPASRGGDPKVLIVAPMSGHYATLLRGTVEAMLPEHDVFITDWTDARDVPLRAGRFDLDDYTDYLIEMLDFIATASPQADYPATGSPETGPGTSGPSAPRVVSDRVAVMAVCQPGIPVLAAASLMAEDGNPACPSTLVLMGSPIDTACSPQQPNDFAQRTPLASFERNAIMRVPWPHPGFGRRVYPGFLQLSSFLAMNLDRHVSSHLAHFRSLVRGDDDSADAHRRFYDEYLAVMDLPGEFYLQTIDRVFQQRLMARGLYRYRGRQVRPEAMRDIALMTVEGEKDDITGVGQTEAAHRLASGLPSEQRRHLLVEAVGHYGIFNGSRWRRLIQPQVRDFIRANSGPRHAASKEQRVQFTP